MLSVYSPDEIQKEKDAKDHESWKDLSNKEIADKYQERFLKRTYVTIRYRTKTLIE